MISLYSVLSAIVFFIAGTGFGMIFMKCCIKWKQSCKSGDGGYEARDSDPSYEELDNIQTQHVTPQMRSRPKRDPTNMNIIRPYGHIVSGRMLSCMG